MKEIPLGNGRVALVDDEDYEKVLRFGKWTYHNRGYAWHTKSFCHVMMHHLLVEVKEGEEVDHINGNKLDNRKENLRSVPHQLNMLNATSLKSKPSKFPRGVYQCGSGRYVATIMWKQKRTHLGTFDTIEEASLRFQQELQKRINETYDNEIARDLQHKRLSQSVRSTNTSSQSLSPTSFGEHEVNGR